MFMVVYPLLVDVVDAICSTPSLSTSQRSNCTSDFHFQPGKAIEKASRFKLYGEIETRKRNKV